MSQGGDNPFQSMGGARPQAPSPVPKLVAVGVTLVVLVAICGGLVAKFSKGMLYAPLTSGIYKNTKEEAKEVKDDDIWTEYEQDAEMADKSYGERWVIVSGQCADPQKFSPDGSALNEQVVLEVGKRASQFNQEWKILCKVPSGQAKKFLELQEGTKVKVRGYCKGMSKDHQVVLEDCELVWRGL
jgi:hypothetical protein